LRRVASLLDLDSADSLYGRLLSLWTDPDKVVVGGREPSTALTDNRLWGSLTGVTERMMFLDMLLYLPEDILTKVDRASMAVGLESRAPFLDPRVVELAWSLPIEFKIHGGRGKRILRDLLATYVPPALTDRPKMGFGVPIDSWLRGPLRDWAEALLDSRRLAAEGFLDPPAVRLVWEQHLAGASNRQYPLWAVLMFQAWLEKESAQKSVEPAAGRVESRQR
jgi:asparagine synthase (glutamine-hydrolysing)